jgi:hypothetical protein
VSDLVLRRGRTAILDFGPVSRVDDSTDPPTVVPLDLLVPGTKLWLVAKRNPTDADADAVIFKKYVAGGVSDAGWTIDAIGDNNTGSLEILVPANLAQTEKLPWELIMEEPTGRRDTVDGGYAIVRYGVSNPP